VSRLYPALDVTWPAPPDTEGVDRRDRVDRLDRLDPLDRLLASVDDDAPTAVEERDEAVRIFFATPGARDAAARRLSADRGLACAAVDVSDEDWAARSQSALGSVQVGAIVVAPPWDVEAATRRAAGAEAASVIEINPSMGFGTGHHASTRLCLALLQRLTIAGRSVLDVGTGSGVLALAAWRLGARPVVAIDSDVDALAAAAGNVERNGATPVVRLMELDVMAPDPAGRPSAPAFDVVLANLTGALLERAAGDLAARVAPGGHLVASGFQADEAAAVARAMSQAGLGLRDDVDEDGWVGAVFAR